jgi:hypothetical protein
MVPRKQEGCFDLQDRCLKWTGLWTGLHYSGLLICENL